MGRGPAATRYTKGASMRRVAVLAIVTSLSLSIGNGQELGGIAADMAARARALLRALDARQLALAQLDFDDANRHDWHYVPRRRQGLPHKSMDDAESALAHALMDTALSETGRAKARGIMALDQVLFEQSGRAMRDSELYYVTVFGEPGARGPWGWRVEGHHLSLNLTVEDGEVISTSPTFMGANPAVVRDGPRAGLEVLDLEQNLARRLLQSFDGAQRARVVYADRPPRDIETGAARRAEPGAPRGLPMSAMASAQKALLTTLVEVYARRLKDELADRELDRIRAAGLDGIHFAWAGGAEPGQPHYYRIQGPTFLIEYDNRQNGANHIHSVWRDLTGRDFGEDLLARHYAESPHHGATRRDATVVPAPNLSVGLAAVAETSRAPLAQRR